MLYKNITIFILFVIMILIYVPSTYAAQIKSYLVTEERELYGNPHLNTVYYHKSISIPYKSGRVILSATPDGTGETSVGEEINIISNYPVNDNLQRNNGCFTSKMKPMDITHLMWRGSFDANTTLTIQFRYKSCREFKTIDGQTKQYAKIGPLYVVYLENDPAPTPFLDLPWDYKADKNSFNDVAYLISSYFDHAYPLLSISNISEPSENNQNIMRYDGQQTKDPYSSHDGYDYAYMAGARLGDSVLAAAPGVATYVNTCNACGNAIYIDHENGYQTRYYHLQKDGLITHTPGIKINVAERQQIGKVGFSGNVNPQSEGGAHIHFMVIHDKNSDGNFEDNIPDGVIDPYGWQNDNPDPWEHYTFSLDGIEKTGSKSHYLWKYNIPKVSTTISFDKNESITTGRYTTDYNKGFLVHDTIFKGQYVSVSTTEPQLKPVGPGIEIKIWDGVETFFTKFKNTFALKFNFKDLDISRLKKESLSIYSSTDGKVWKKEDTTIDVGSSTATSHLNHLTQFVLMGEKIDSLAPVTSLTINGKEISTDSSPIYNGPVSVELDVSDTPLEESLGIEHTLYQINDNEWQQYKDPVILTDVGLYEIKYYSVDQDGNTENTKNTTVEIQAILQPETTITYNLDTSLFNITGTENIQPSRETIKIGKRTYEKYTYTQGSKETSLIIREQTIKGKKRIYFYSIQYNEDLPILFPKSTFTVRYKGNKLIKQSFRIKNNTNVILKYNEKKNQTKVLIDTEEPSVQKGMSQLKIYTKEGSLYYSIN